MAPKGRKDESQSNGKSKGGIRFRYMDSERLVDFSVDNDDANVTDGLRLIANALAGRNIAVAPPKLLKKAGAGSTEVLDPKEDEETLEQPLPFPAPESEDEREEEHEEVGTVSERKQSPAPRAPKFLDELNLPTARVSLADFIKEKDPTSDSDKYAVIATWFKQHFDTEEISIDHIFTAYRALGWQAQLPGPDPSQTLRNLKNNKNWLVSGTKRGHYKVNWNGEDSVNKMGAAKSS